MGETYKVTCYFFGAFLILVISAFVAGFLSEQSAERIELARIQLAAAQYCGGGK